MTQHEPPKGHHPHQESWGSKLGVILAVAGSAIGLGNFLRFPVQAAQNGGGAFMLPYFVALLCLGLPLAWVEWALGRYGGLHGHNTASGAFAAIWHSRWAKYLGLLGVFGPLVIFIYYTYIESWTLAYSSFALSGKYAAVTDQQGMRSFLAAFQGLESNEHFQGIGTAYFFFLLTFTANIWVMALGIRRGIELVSKICMPVLFLLGVGLMIRIMTLGAPHPDQPEWHVLNGFGYMWNPQFGALTDAKVWLAASGQILFTLSVGIGCILTYASYLKEKDDVALSALSAVSFNEVAEVIIGGSIILPAAFVFFGPVEIGEVARSGAFNLGFVTMPLILQHVPWGNLFGFAWFLLLFLAGITSSISLAQPIIAFLHNVLGYSRRRAVAVFAAVTFLLAHAAVFGLSRGVVDELDFWGGTFALVLFATIEAVLFAWVFGMERGWREIHRGAEIRVPRLFQWIIRYVTPTYLLIVLVAWLHQQGIPTLLLQGVSEANRPYVIGTRVGLTLSFLGFALLLRGVLRHRRIKELAEQ